MSATVCAEINRRLRALGYTVHEAPGWQTRGRSMDTAFVGGLVHHTATQYAVAVPGNSIYNMLFLNGRPDLSPPLCNYAGNSDGSLTCGAAGVANHAGKSGGYSMGPLPVTDSFNKRVLGLEIAYPGDKPMTDAQYGAACAWARVVADVVGGGDIERVRAHAETSVTGKWDPGYAPGKTIDMAAFRAAARQGVQDMDAMQDARLHDVYQTVVGGAGYANTNLARQLGYVVSQINVAKSETALATSAALSANEKLDTLSSKVDAITAGRVDVVQLAEALKQYLPTPEQVADVLAQRLAE